MRQSSNGVILVIILLLVLFLLVESFCGGTQQRKISDPDPDPVAVADPPQQKSVPCTIDSPGYYPRCCCDPQSKCIASNYYPGSPFC